MEWGRHAGELVTLALVVGAFLFARRYGGGVALESLERSNRVLTSRVHELEQANVTLTAEIATLRARTDVSLAIAPVLKALELHEERAGERSSRTLDVLDLIAKRLGPEAEAA
jgi:hypothetical protein